MNRQDWIDYFEALNGRSPEVDEIKAAAQAGEFINDVTETAYNSNQNAQNPNYYHSVNDNNQTFQERATNHSQNFAMSDFKQKGRSYLNWFLPALKNPVSSSETSNFTYTAVTLVLSALLFGGALVNFIRRIIQTIIGVTVDGKSFRTESPEVYDKVSSVISSELGMMTVVTVSFFILCLYLASISLPVLVEKMSKQNTNSFSYEVGKSSQFLPVLLVTNLLAFLSTFLVKTDIFVSSKAFWQIQDLFLNENFNLFEILAKYLSVVKEIPTLKSMGDVAIYLLIFNLISFLILVVALVKNITSTYKKINSFYLSIISIFALCIVSFYVNKEVFNSLVNVFKNLYQIFNS